MKRLFSMNLLNAFLLPGLLLVLTLGFGVWLSVAGKPYNGILFNIHKLVALAAVVLAVLQFNKMFKVVPATSMMILLLVLAGLCVLALFLSGAFLSIGSGPQGVFLWLHRITPAVMLVAVVTAGWLIAKGLPSA